MNNTTIKPDPSRINQHADQQLKMRYIKPIIVSLTSVTVTDAWNSRPSLRFCNSVGCSKSTTASTLQAISNSPFLPDTNHLVLTSSAFPTTHTNADKEASVELPLHLIHKGRAVSMIKRCVAVEGLSISKGWMPHATAAFKLAIEAVVRANPILTGKLIEVKRSPWPWSQQSELWVVPNAFPPDSHSFVTMVDPPSDLMSPGKLMQDEGGGAKESTQALFKHVYSNVAPSLLSEVSFTTDQIAKGSPLFEAKIMDFGDGVAAYSIKMSHAIGDGTTFFQLVSQISSYMNGRTPARIDWDNPLKTTHEIYPETFSDRDYTRSYGLPFGWGLFKNLRTLGKRKLVYLLLSKEKIARKKKALNGEGSGSEAISANDVIMSALCEMCGSSDIFAFDKSVRGNKEGLPKSAAGNLFCEVPFDKEDGKDPSFFRKIVNGGSYFHADDIPLLPFLNGRVGRITSLASVTHQANFPGVELVCQLPSASFIKDLPLDVAVIFRFDKDYWGIMHNFRNVNPSPQLDEIIA